MPKTTPIYLFLNTKFDYFDVHILGCTLLQLPIITFKFFKKRIICSVFSPFQGLDVSIEAPIWDCWGRQSHVSLPFMLPIPASHALGLPLSPCISSFEHHMSNDHVNNSPTFKNEYYLFDVHILECSSLQSL